MMWWQRMQGGISIVVSAWIWWLRVPLLSLAIALVVGVTAAVPVVAAKIEAPQIARDIAIYHIARARAGDEAPLELDIDPTEGLDYTRGAPLNPTLTFNTFSNSLYLSDLTREVISQAKFERVMAQDFYPQAVVFYPWTGNTRFELHGRAVCMDGAVALNERMVMGPEGNRDGRVVLSVLTHELIHLQFGNYCASFQEIRKLREMYAEAERLSKEGDTSAAREITNEIDSIVEEISIRNEGHTQAATLETLAGLCLFENELACRSFWFEVQGLTNGSIKTRLSAINGIWAWNLYKDVFLRTQEERLISDKWDRYWAKDPAKRQEIIEKYQYLPWEELVLPGLCGSPMDTGTVIGFSLRQNESGDTVTREFRLAMPFDDTQVLLGSLSLLCHLN